VKIVLIFRAVRLDVILPKKTMMIANLGHIVLVMIAENTRKILIQKFDLRLAAWGLTTDGLETIRHRV